MKEPPTPSREDERLKTLADYNLLETPNEEVFDAFARVAAQSCGTPVAVITLAGPKKVVFKSHYGLPEVAQTPLAGSFCSFTIADKEIMEVSDARKDPRFAKHPQVTAPPHLVFYAGAPLVTPSGVVIGSIAVVDNKPHTLTPDQRAGLRAIADVVMEQFELRRQLAADQSKVNDRLRLLSAAMEATEEAVAIASFGATPDDPVEVIYANQAYLRTKGATMEQVVGTNAMKFIGPRTDKDVLRHMREMLLQRTARTR